MLYGRSAQCDVLERLLADARRSRSAALVVRGGAGAGKTALLEHAAGRADGMLVLRANGVESEAELPFAALHQLLRPVLRLAGRLPEPQANALGEALAFAARRRLEAEGVVCLFAAHDGDLRDFPAAGLPELRLEGLEADDAAALLAGAGADLPAEVVGRLVERTGGNPLALLELPGSLAPSSWTGGRRWSTCCPSPPGSSGPSASASAACPARPGCSCWWRRPRPPATRPWCCGSATGSVPGPRPSRGPRRPGWSGPPRAGWPSGTRWSGRPPT